jgi:hypothetical protein
MELLMSHVNTGQTLRKRAREILDVVESSSWYKLTGFNVSEPNSVNYMLSLWSFFVYLSINEFNTQDSTTVPMKQTATWMDLAIKQGYIFSCRKDYWMFGVNKIVKNDCNDLNTIIQHIDLLTRPHSMGSLTQEKPELDSPGIKLIYWLMKTIGPLIYGFAEHVDFLYGLYIVQEKNPFLETQHAIIEDTAHAQKFSQSWACIASQRTVKSSVGKKLRKIITELHETYLNQEQNKDKTSELISYLNRCMGILRDIKTDIKYREGDWRFAWPTTRHLLCKAYTVMIRLKLCDFFQTYRGSFATCTDIRLDKFEHILEQYSVKSSNFICEEMRLLTNMGWDNYVLNTIIGMKETVQDMKYLLSDANLEQEEKSTIV